MKFLILFVLFFSGGAFAGFEGFNDGVSLKVFNQIDCKDNLSCSRFKGKFMMSVPKVSPQVAASATTITADQCGSTFSNAAAVQMELPEASTVIGCKLTFVTLNASNFDINPDDADQILVLTNAVGDAIRNATVGNSVTLQAVSASQWVVVGEKGTWTDIN